MSFMQRKPRKPIALADFDPEYARLLAKRDELWAAMSRLRDEAASLSWALQEGAIAARGDGTGHARADQPSASDIAARNLLGDLLPPLAPAPHAAAPGEQRLRAIGAELDTMQRALALLDRPMRAARARASAAACAVIAPEFRDKAKAVAAALAALATAHGDYLALADELRTADVAWADLGPLPTLPTGDPREQWSPIRQALAEMAELGFVK